MGRAKKAGQPDVNLPPKRTLQLVRPSFTNVHLMKAKLWGDVYGKMYGFLSMV
jgi:hypothetical protein